MSSYSNPTYSGWGAGLSHHIGKLSRGLTNAVWGLVVGLFLALPALAAEEVRPTDLVLGDPKATCTIVEYSSFGCVHCAHFHEDVLPTIKKDYIETGKVRMIMRDYPLDRPAFMAEKVARCGGPMRRPAYMAAYFKLQNKWHINGPEMEDEIFKIARQGGMTREQYDVCQADKDVEKSILSDRQEAIQKYEVDSTPAFIMNGKWIRMQQLTVDEFTTALRTACGVK